MNTNYLNFVSSITKGSPLSGAISDALLHTLAPNDFEYYLVALEVRDEDTNKIEDVFLFPVNPESILLVQGTFTTYKKSLAGVHVSDNNTFTPNPVSLSGNFGRGLKTVISGSKKVPLTTGYGATKLLQKIVELSKSTNSKGKPYRTILYNLAFGETYTVIIKDCKFSQNMDKNRIWCYDLNMTTVAPGDIPGGANRKNIMFYGLIDKAMKYTYGEVKNMLKAI